MKILFITDNFPPEVNAPASRTFEHCQEWVKYGVDVTVITCAPNFPKGKVFAGYKNKMYQNEVINGIKVKRVWSYMAANEGFYKRILDYISFSVSSFIVGLFIKTDIIVATSPQFFTALTGRSLSFWKRRPWVMEVRDLWPESVKALGVVKNTILLRYLEMEELRCYKSATKIITVTDAFKHFIINKGIPDTKIEVIKNGSNLDVFHPLPKDKELLNILNLQNKIIVGYIGTHGLAHKLDFILDCAKELQETKYHFLFLGDGSEKKKLLKKADIEQISNVTMLDSVSKDQVCRYLSLLDVSIINLRKNELFKTVIPSKIFESAAMQIPILLGVEGESRAIIEKYNAGLFYEPENKKDFLKKLKIITHKELTASFITGGDSLAKDFNRKNLAQEMLSALRGSIKV